MPDPLLPPLINARQLTALQAVIPKPAAQSSPAPSPSPAAARTWLDGQLRQHLPRAQPLQTTLERWHTALAAVPNTQTRSAEHQLLATFITQLPTAKDLVTPQRLADTLQNSGLWLEAQLAESATTPSQPAPDVSQDLKAQLLCLAAELRAAASANPSSPPAEATEVAVAEIISATLVEAPPVEDAATADSETDADADCDVGDELDDCDALDEGDDGALEVDVDGDDDADAENDGAATFADAEGDPNSNSGAETAPQTFEIKEEDESTAEVPAPSARAHSLAAPALLRDIDGLLGQMVTHQLLSLDATGGRTCWQLELPFRAPDGAIFTLMTELHHNPRREPNGTDSWTVRLQLDLLRLGPLAIQLSVRADRLDAGLQAGTEAGAAVLQEHLATLRTRLLTQRLEVASLHAGYRPLSPAVPPLLARAALIREQC